MWVGCMLAIFEACAEKPVKMYAFVRLILAKTKRCGLAARQSDVRDEATEMWPSRKTKRCER